MGGGYISKVSRDLWRKPGAYGLSHGLTGLRAWAGLGKSSRAWSGLGGACLGLGPAWRSSNEFIKLSTYTVATVST